MALTIAEEETIEERCLHMHCWGLSDTTWPATKYGISHVRSSKTETASKTENDGIVATSPSVACGLQCSNYPKETEPQYANPPHCQHHRARSAVRQLCPFDEHNYKHRFGVGRDDIWRSHHNTTPPAQGSYRRWSSLERLVVAVTSCILKGLCQAVKCDDKKRKVELKENGWVLSLP